ncbi:MAG: tetratricopeptide repeat protein [Atopobiaceae bacterium]|nr:tetratricopeptide repeat protein [Atopobiaceae bacterium]
MNQQAFEAGKAAYRKGDVLEAIEALQQAKDPGEVNGSVDHLIGNCLMKLGRYNEAAAAYGDAMQDSNYGNVGALACNRGRALLAAGKPQEAIASLITATKDSTYPTPYKVQIALGNAYLKVGNPREAGVAFRNAAIDEANPDPSSALRSLGSCFVQMGRPVDAIEAYRTALDFSTPQADQNAIYADLGMAYVAANRMGEAVDAFSRATSDGTYTLSSEASVAFEAAKRAAVALSGGSPSETDQFLNAAGYGTGSYDPLDPMGESGEFMPSPEDTGFFSVSEKELVEQARRDRKVKRKHRHTGRKIFIFLFVLALILAGVAGYGYYRGYGWPSQSAVVNELFSAKSNGDDITGLLATSVDEDTQRQIESVLPSSTTDVKVSGVDRTMTESKVFCTVTLSAGGEQNYEITLLRDGLGWKVASVSAVYPSQNGSAPTLDGEVEAAPTATTSTETTTTPTEGNAQSTAAPAEAAPAETPAEEEVPADEPIEEETYEEVAVEENEEYTE